MLATILALGSYAGIQSWRLGNSIEDRDTARTAFDNEKSAHKATKELLTQAGAANAKYRALVFTLERTNKELTDARSAIEAQTAKRVADAEKRRVESDKVLASFLERFARATRDPGCKAALSVDLRECLR
jgi:hypothetical protein